MDRALFLKVVLGVFLAVVFVRFVYRRMFPTDPLDAASSALRDRLFSTIKKPWDD